MTAQPSPARRRRPKAPGDEQDSAAIRIAGLLAYFEPFSLAEIDEDPDRAIEHLMELAQPLSNPAGYWGLSPDIRRQLLQRFADRDAARAALAAVEEPPKVPVQTGIALLLAGPEAVAAAIKEQDPDVLGGLIQARTWIDGIAHLETGLPSGKRLTAALVEARRTAPLRQLVGEHFSGRDDILETLQNYLDRDTKSSDILFLYGPGGIGKSTVLAKFALDATASDLLDGVAYLNLDRPILRPEEPMTLLEDMLLQISDQIDGAAEVLAPAIEDTGRLLQDLAAGSEETSVLEDAATFGGGTAWERVLGTSVSCLNALPGDRPILVILDTFEQAWNQGKQIVAEIWRMGMRLAEDAPRLRIVAAGRVTEPGFTSNAVKLRKLEYADVARILERTVGRIVPDDLTDAVFEGTEGFPLTVRLTAIAIAQEGLDKFDDPKTRQDLLQQLQDDSRIALLYGRILDQIAEADVRKLAVPGLVMRRITVAAIMEVLAEPCGLQLDHAQAESLFRKMARVSDLVTLDASDPDAPALVHRLDVRELMLPPLRQRERARAARIDDLAIAHFEGQPGRHARAEEIYHRLWRGDPVEVLETRWSAEAAPLLSDALKDVPEPGRAWLAGKLGVAAGLEQFIDAMFTGRAALLGQILGHIGDPGPRPPMLVRGLGGIGKTTLFAQSAAQAQEEGLVAAVAYIDLAALPEEALRQSLASILAHLAKTLPWPGPEAQQDLMEIIADVTQGAPLPGDFDRAFPGEDSPILIVADNLDGTGATNGNDAQGPVAALNTLAAASTRLRLLVGARQDVTGLDGPVIELTGLDSDDVANLVTRIAGEPVPGPELEIIMRATQGHPLSVRLIGQLILERGYGVLTEIGETLDDPGQDASRTGFLFRRILDRVADPDLRIIIQCGVVPRRLTPDLIRDVLGDALSLSLSDQDAHRLFDTLVNEIGLVEPDHTEPGEPGLKFLADLRTAVLPDIRSADPAACGRIDRAAIEYYRARTGPVARAEEIYHRLWRGDDRAVLDDRWDAEAGPYLTNALSELSANGRVWLSLKLGLAPPVDAEVDLDQDRWETSAIRTARQMMAKGSHDAALAILDQRSDRLPGSALFALEAELRASLGHTAQAERVLARGIASAHGAGNTRREAELYLLSSLFKERRRAFAHAAEDALEAWTIARDTRDEEFQLRAIAALLRLSRKTRKRVGADRHELKSKALDLIYQPKDPKNAPESTSKGVKVARAIKGFLRDNVALSRDLAAEMGPEAPELLEMSIDQSGISIALGDDAQGKNARALVKAAVDRLADIEAGEFGTWIRSSLGSGIDGLMRQMPELLSLARDRDVLDQVSRPISWVLSADVDQRTGALPSRSMIERHTGLTL